MIHGYTIAINSTNNCDRVPLPHLHDVHFPQKSSTVKERWFKLHLNHIYGIYTEMITSYIYIKIKVKSNRYFNKKNKWSYYMYSLHWYSKEIVKRK